MSRVRTAVVIALLCCLCSKISAERKSYDNYHVFKVQPKNLSQLGVLKGLDGIRETFLFLEPVVKVGSSVHVLVAPQKVKEFEALIGASQIPSELLERNAQSQLENNEVADPNRRNIDEYTWTQYHELDDTYNWMRSLAKKYPDNVSTFVVGSSYEKRDILGIKISYGPGKKGIFIEGGMHAREWIGPATSTYIANQILTSQDKAVRMIAQSFDWYIVPHTNPDGFAYTHTNDRLWRKTRSPQGTCFGVDPNRNWDFHWNEVGSSDKPCSDTFAGPSAFSEIETKSLAQFIESMKEDIFLYISFHSYSQLLLFPYGHTGELPPNYDDLKRIFDAAIIGMKERYGTKYTGGNIHDAIYPASGASVDWTYGVADIKYSFCYELRPSSYQMWTGFKLPAAQIIPTGEETLDSVIAMIKEAGIMHFF